MATKKPPEVTRRPHRSALTILPEDGPDEPTPKWPLDKMRKGEKARWDALWRRPVAAMWHQVQCYEEVARYVRLVVRADDVGGDGSGVTFQAMVNRMADSLGITPKAWYTMNLRIAPSRPAAPVSDLDEQRQRLTGSESS